MGTAVGIASIVGYAPDFFMPAMFGRWIDNAIKANNLSVPVHRNLPLVKIGKSKL